MYSFLVNCPDSGGDSAEVVPPPELSERHVDPQELHQRASLVFQVRRLPVSSSLLFNLRPLQEPAWPFDDLKPKDRKFAIFLGLLVIGGGFLMILFPPPLEEDHPTASWWIARVVFTYGLIYMLVPLLRWGLAVFCCKHRGCMSRCLWLACVGRPSWQSGMGE